MKVSILVFISLSKFTTLNWREQVGLTLLCGRWARPTCLPKSWKIPLSDKKLYMPKKYMWGVSTIDDDTIKNICRLYVVREARLEICNMFMYIGG